MKRLFLVAILATTLVGCEALSGPAIEDPVTGETIESPLKEAGKALAESLGDIAPAVAQDVLSDGELSDTSKLAIGGSVLAALLVGLGAYGKRRKAKAKAAS